VALSEEIVRCPKCGEHRMQKRLSVCWRCWCRIYPGRQARLARDMYAKEAIGDGRDELRDATGLHDE
jgi:hypothetical protein